MTIAPEAPVEIIPTVRGADIYFPRRPAGKRAPGCFLVLFGLFFCFPPSMVLLSTQDDAIQLLFLIPFFLVGLGVFCGGMFMLFGRSSLHVDYDRIRLRHGVGPLAFGPTMRLDQVRQVTLLPAAMARTALGNSLQSGQAISIVGENGQTIVAGRGLSREQLKPAADEIAQRCGLAAGDATSFSGDMTVTGLATNALDTAAGGRHRLLRTGQRLTDVTLTPAASQASLPCLFAAAVFWNGISWTVFGVMLVNDAPWFAFLFIAIFLLIGVALIGGVIHALLAHLRMHAPTIVVRRQPLYLGETLRGQFTQQVKKATSVTLVSLKLVCRETATYRRGTKTSTATHDAWSSEVVICEGATADRLQPLTGEFEIPIPADGMHTFIGARNNIKWLLIVGTQVPSWPDFKCEYEIHMAPRRVAAS